MICHPHSPLGAKLADGVMIMGIGLDARCSTRMMITFAVWQKGKLMGTNYYAVRNRPTTEEPIHIGKSSLGWKFNFQTQNEKWNEPPVVWNTYDQVYEWLHKYTVESDLYVIIDEYDEIISFDDFVALVEKKQSENNPDDFTYSKNVNGYRFSDGEFC